jgi:hypothetical protein
MVAIGAEKVEVGRRWKAKHCSRGLSFDAFHGSHFIHSNNRA